VSCASPGNCAAAGNYTDARRHQQVFIAEEKNGTWNNALGVPGLAALDKSDAAASAVSCASRLQPVYLTDPKADRHAVRQGSPPDKPDPPVTR
jgi:hypothetical protein